ncbi:hypothetical protein [Demequina lutea]|uniref:Uncharacterized protein n=1 Tax=Demequina lutea TaxID=431489 RepID=A0A7Y9ZAZ1_9MICO|nr:hypothetical protein [Demequina lutea]NYI42067.1 hypothetical protein [Demequina lutea]
MAPRIGTVDAGGLMGLSGTSSWRLELNDTQLLYVALYIRDVAGIQVPVDPSVPPSLRNVAHGVAPDPHVDAAALSSQWLDWWRSLVAFEVENFAAVRAAQMSHVPAQDRMRELADAHAAVFDPPEFASLAGSPDMREVAALRFREALEWFSGRSGTPRHSRLETPATSHAVIVRAAEGVAAERGVDLDRLDAAIEVLDVSGPWVHVAAPGYVLCSAELARDDDAAEDVVRRAFTSGLDAPPRT